MTSRQNRQARLSGNESISGFRFIILTIGENLIMKKLVFMAFIFYVFIFSVYSQKIPVVDSLTMVSKVSDEQSKGISAITFHDGLIWCLVFDKKATGKGQYAIFNPETREWKYSDSEISQKAILFVSQPFNSPSGLVFVGSKLCF